MGERTFNPEVDDVKMVFRAGGQIPVKEGFLDAFKTFLAGMVKIEADYRAQHYANNPAKRWCVDLGVKRARVVCDGGAHCFVDFATGDVLKPDGWKRPAKHARGNIFDDKNGLGLMGPYGPAYLR